MKVLRSRNVYGGRVYDLEFDKKPILVVLHEAIRTLDSCPFGWRTMGEGPLENGKYMVSVKIHND
jgi:hypothetical protein